MSTWPSISIAERRQSSARHVRKINAEYSHRFSADFIRRTYASLADAFEQGNFVLVADSAEDGSELQGMAFILSGLVEKGVLILSRRSDLSVRAKVVLAFGYWFLDRPQSAISVLIDCPRRGPDGVVADELHKLILARRINVLQIVVRPQPSSDPTFADPFWSARQRVGQFELRNVATQAAHDCSIEDDFAEFVSRLPADEKPSFALAMVSDWFLPRNIEKSSVPLVMWTHDQDHFMHRNYDNYRFCSLNVVTTSQEHFEMAHGCGIFCASNLLTEPFFATFEKPVQKAGPKDIDLLFTSTGFNFFFSDKSRFLFNLSRLSEEFNLRYVDGRLPYDEYMNLTARSRFVPVVSRVCGNPSPRWRETLAAGSFLLYPAQTLFNRVTAGCFAYGEGSFVEDIRRHMSAARTGSGDGYDHNAALAQIAKDFATYRATRELRRERFLRFASFMLVMKNALRWELPAQAQPAPRRRFVWLSAPVTIHYFQPNNVLTKVLEAADRVHATAEWQDVDYNNLALVFHTCALMLRTQGVETQLPHLKFEELTGRASAWIDDGLKRFPRSLLLQFNAAQWPVVEDAILGRPPRKSAMKGFQEIIERFDDLEFDPLNADVGHQHFHMHDPVFPHFAYGQLAVVYAVARRHPELVALSSLPDPKLALLGAAHGYIGHAEYSEGRDEEALGHFDAALRVFPNNQPLCNLRFACLKRLTAACGPRSDRDDRLIDAFFDIADKYPVILLKEVHTIVPVLRRRKRIEEMKALLLDWYRYAKTLDENSLKSYLGAEAAAVLLDHMDYFPEGLRSAITLRTRAGPVPLSPLEIALATMRVHGRLVKHGNRLFHRLRRIQSYRALYRFVVPSPVRLWVRAKLALDSPSIHYQSAISGNTTVGGSAVAPLLQVSRRYAGGVKRGLKLDRLIGRQATTRQEAGSPSRIGDESLPQTLSALKSELDQRLREIDLLKHGGGRDFAALEHAIPLSPARPYRFEEMIDWSANGFAIADPPPPLIFVHVQKTGGTFLNSILVRNFRLRVDAWGEKFFAKLYPEEFYTLIQAPNGDDTLRPAFFTGHIALGNEIFDRIRGRYLCVSLLRDPVDRLVSHYTFHMGLPNNHLNEAIHRDKLGLIDYFQRFPEIPRQFHSFLTAAERTSADAVKIAIHNLESRLSIFGLQERMTEYVVLLSYFLGLPNLLYQKRLNVSRAGAAMEGVDAAQRQKLAALMPEELEFYAGAKALYLNRLARVSIDVAALVRRFDQLNKDGRDPGAEIEAERGRRHPWTDAYF